MALTTICSPDAVQVIEGAVYPLAALSAVVTAIIIGISYMLGQALSNARLSLWAKSELFQLLISLFAVILILQGINTFCLLDMGSIYSLVSPTPISVSPGFSVYSAAESYLMESGVWIHSLLDTARYHIGAYNVLQSFGRNKCEGVDPSVNWIFCLFGPLLPNPTGGSGASSVNIAPDSGYGLLTSALGVSFNTIVFSYLSVLNYLFILRFVSSGFVLFFLPLGIFLRSVPYLRTLGSLLMSVAISFFMVYPLILAAFYMDFKSAKVLTPDSSAFTYLNTDMSDYLTISAYFSESLYDDVFPDEEFSLEIIKLTGNAFLLGVFIPSLALLASAAAVSYINRFLGEEIDLSRVVQMM